jgi:hypothetical protein
MISETQVTLYVVPERKGADQLDRSCKKCRSITDSQERKTLSKYNKMKESQLDWSHIRKNCLVTCVIEETMERKRRRRRGRKQPL